LKDAAKRLGNWSLDDAPGAVNAIEALLVGDFGFQDVLAQAKSLMIVEAIVTILEIGWNAGW
jgi:hypothetical protein